MEVDINLIKPSPYQPRIVFNIEDLKQEIASGGLLSELIIRRKDAHFELIDGERRFKIAKELGWKTIPVQFIDVDDREARRRVFRLNRHRRNYSAEEEAKFFKKLSDEGMSSYEIAQDLGANDNWVRANLNIFKFPEDIQQSVWGGDLSPSHIEELGPVIIASFERAKEIAKECKEQKLTRDQLRKLLKPELAAIEQARIKAAQEKLGQRETIPLPTESLEEQRRSFKALEKAAREKQLELVTEEEKRAVEARREEKKHKVLESQERQRETIKKRALNEALQSPEFLKIAIGKAQTILPADEVKRAADHPTTLPDKCLAEIFRAPRETWQNLINAAERRAWTILELAAVVDIIRDENAPYEYKLQLQKGLIDPAINKGGEPAILEDTAKRYITEALARNKAIAFSSALVALSKLENFDAKEVVDVLDNFDCERIIKDIPRDIEYLQELIQFARERLET